MGNKASDLDKILEAVENYFQGMYHSDTERLKKAFHPEAYLMGYFQGKLARIPLEGWLGMIAKTPAPASGGEVYDMKIVSTDVKENVASVKVEDLYRGLRFTDYLTLIKFGDEWKIVHKAFYHEPKKS
jgi:hypothetical protein